MTAGPVVRWPRNDEMKLIASILRTSFHSGQWTTEDVVKFLEKRRENQIRILVSATGDIMAVVLYTRMARAAHLRRVAVRRKYRQLHVARLLLKRLFWSKEPKRPVALTAFVKPRQRKLAQILRKLGFTEQGLTEDGRIGMACNLQDRV